MRGLGGAVEIDPTPQEVPWSVPLDEDEEHARYDPAQVASYFAAATRAALVLAAFRAPYRGRSTPVNAWWGSFDLAVSLFSGRAGRSAVGRLHHAQRDGRAGGRRSAGGPAIRATARRPSMPTRTRRRRGSPTRRSRPRRRAGTRRWASTSWTGTTSAPARIHGRSRWSSPGRPSATPASFASGTRRSASADGTPPPVQKGAAAQPAKKPFVTS